MVYAVMPCVIINAFQVDYSPAVVTGLLYAFALAIALHALLLLLARLLRRPLRLDVIERTCIIYTNAGILVIPLVRALLGEDYVIYSWCVPRRTAGSPVDALPQSALRYARL